MPLILFLSGSVYATDHNSGGWFGTFISKPLDEKYSLWAESQLRYDDSDGGMQQVLIRTGVLRTLNEKHKVGLLYLLR